MDVLGSPSHRVFVVQWQRCRSLYRGKESRSKKCLSQSMLWVGALVRTEAVLKWQAAAGFIIGSTGSGAAVCACRKILSRRLCLKGAFWGCMSLLPLALANCQTRSAFGAYCACTFVFLPLSSKPLSASLFLRVPLSDLRFGSRAESKASVFDCWATQIPLGLIVPSPLCVIDTSCRASV